MLSQTLESCVATEGKQASCVDTSGNNAVLTGVSTGLSATSRLLTWQRRWRLLLLCLTSSSPLMYLCWTRPSKPSTGQVPTKRCAGCLHHNFVVYAYRTFVNVSSADAAACQHGPMNPLQCVSCLSLAAACRVIALICTSSSDLPKAVVCGCPSCNR